MCFLWLITAILLSEVAMKHFKEEEKSDFFNLTLIKIFGGGYEHGKG